MWQKLAQCGICEVNFRFFPFARWNPAETHPNLPTLPYAENVGQKKSPTPKGIPFVQLKHDHPNASPCGSILCGIHPSEGLRAPVIKIEVEQSIARSELRGSSCELNEQPSWIPRTLTLSSFKNSGLSISVSALKTSNFAWSAKIIASPTSSVNRRFRSPRSSAFSTKAVSVA